MLLSSLTILSITVQAQQRHRMEGSVVEMETGSVLPGVHIYTASFRAGTISDENGRFYLSVEDTDTVLFTSIGYETLRLTLTELIGSDVPVTVRLRRRVYELDEVQVTAYKNYESFRKAIIELDIPTEEKGFKLEIPKDAFIHDRALPPHGEAGVVIKGPASALYNAFSKEAKERRKLASLREKTTEQKIIDDRYNLEVVKRITSLNDEGAKRFMEWCTFEDTFILTATEYDLTVAMLKCLDEFSTQDTLR